MTLPASVPLVGHQLPRLAVVPPRVSSAGAEAIELARHAGLELDPWQEYVVDVALSEREDGRLAAFEVGLIVARQNGKGGVLEALELAWLFLLGERLILHSAHEFKTSIEAYRRVTDLVKNCPDLDRLVKKYPSSHGDEGIELKDGRRLRFIARSKGSGRGFSGDKVVLDEAYELGAKQMGALMPTLSARPDPQIVYASSAPMRTSETLRQIRNRALRILADPTVDPGRFAFLEWSAPEDADPDDVDAIAMANPALGIRIELDFIQAERETLPREEFRRERLSIPDPDPGERPEPIIPMTAWLAAEDAKSSIDGPVVLSADINPSRTWGSLAVAGRRTDGLWHVEVVEHQAGTQWMVDRIVQIRKRHDVRVVTLDPSGPAGSLLGPLLEVGVEVQQVSARGHAQACGLLFDLATATGPDGSPLPGVRHLGQPVLLDALQGADRRPLGDAWAWRRTDDGVDISPLVAATLALGAAVGLPDTAAAAPVFAY